MKIVNKKIKNSLKIIIAIILIAISGILFKVYALDMNNTGSPISVVMFDHEENGYVNLNNENAWNLFCIQNGERLNDYTEFSPTRVMQINGKRLYAYNGSTPEDKGENDENLEIAWLFSQKGRYGNSNHIAGVYSDRQKAIYALIGNLISRTGWNVATACNQYSSVPDNITTDFNDFKKDANIQASIENKTDSSKITVEAYEESDGSYVKVGPFNINYSQTLTGIEAYSKTGKRFDIKFRTYNGDKLEPIGYSNIVSGKDFYILINDSEDELANGIGRLDVHAQATGKTINASIWVLEHDAYQNLITGEATINDNPTKLDIPYTFDIDVLGKLSVIKVNKDNEKVKLKGVKFYIQRNSGKYVFKDGDKIKYVTDVKDATVFETDENGKIEVDKLIVGKYKAIEISNPNYGYEFDKNGIEINVKASDYTNIVGNKQKWIKLSGYVWTDIKTGKGNQNDLYKDNDYDINDTKMAGIIVKLKDKKTNDLAQLYDPETGKELAKEAAITKTSDGKDGKETGTYQFGGLLIENLENYYVEFEYDGLVYTNVVAHTTVDNGSKAAEISDKNNINSRYQFNLKFSSVERSASKTDTTQESYGQTLDQNGKVSHDDLTYDRKVEKDAYGDEFYSSELNHQKSVYNITANTNQTDYKIKDHFAWGIEEIKYVNLGLKNRQQPQMQVYKDVENAELAINGNYHVYKYANVSKNLKLQDADSSLFNVGVKFKSTFGTYTRAVYKSDIDYIDANGDKDRELKAYVTYKIEVQNSKSGLKLRANSVVDYYNSKYTPISAGTELNEKGRATGIEFTTKETSNGYNKIEIPMTKTMNSGEVSDVYVTFQLDRETIISILNNNEGLDNVAEVSSYSVFDGNGDVYAGIDSLTAPENVIPGDKTTYENDTSTAPLFQLKLADSSRSITGTVFEDSADPEKLKLNFREGDGTYTQSTEHGIGGVEVTLTVKDGAKATGGSSAINSNVENSGVETNVGTDGNTQTTIKVKTLTKDEATAKGSNYHEGDFEIKGYIPGTYDITYTWGGQTYTDSNSGITTTYDVRNYKSTIVDESSYSAKGIENGQDGYWQKDAFKQKYAGVEWDENNNTEIRVSDALDNYETRKLIDEQATVTTNGTNSRAGVSSSSITTMDSTTPQLILGVENQSSLITDDLTGKNYTYAVNSIDFGIIERPRQDLKLTKTTSHVKLTLLNQQVLIDADIIDGKLSGTTKGLTYMAPSATSTPTNGLLKLEVDNEMLQGSTLEVTYTITAKNNSELDYLNKEFSEKGTKAKNGYANMATITPNIIVDYLDKDWTFDKIDKNGNSQNADWNEWSLDEYKNQKDTLGKTLAAAEVLNSDEIQLRRILHTESLESKKLSAGDTETVNMNVSKQLTTADEILLDNDTEVLKITKTVGTVPQSTPGNHVPGDISTITTTGTVSQENDYSVAETTTVTPPTGENKNNVVVYIVLGLSALMGLGIGIFVIKKKALKE